MNNADIEKATCNKGMCRGHFLTITSWRSGNFAAYLCNPRPFSFVVFFSFLLLLSLSLENISLVEKKVGP